MIDGMKVSNDLVQNMLNELNRSRFIFHLIGSRYFSPTCDPIGEREMDYDLYTQDNPEVRSYLESLGFSTVEDDIGYLGNPNQVSLYRVFAHTDKHIDVQLVLDVEAKNLVQKCLKDLSGMRGRYNKEERRELWHFAFKLYDAAKKTVKVTNLKTTKGLQTRVGTLVVAVNPNSLVDSNSFSKLTVGEAILFNQKLKMIKWWRTWTDAGLKEAKDIIDLNWESWKSQLQLMQSLYPEGCKFVLTFNSFGPNCGIDYVPLDQAVQIYQDGKYIDIPIKQAIVENNRIAVIKWLRGHANLGLKDAKDVIDANWEEWRRKLQCA